MGYDWNFSILTPYTNAFLNGALITIFMSVISFIGGSLIGLLFGVFFRMAPGARILFLLNDCVRAVPQLVMLFIVYYFPFKEVFGIEPPSAFWVAVLALGIIQAAYTAELVRAAIEQTPHKAIMAGLALGLGKFMLWRFIILPDIIRQITPAQIAFFIGTVRASSLASVIGAQDVVFVAHAISGRTFRSFEPWVAVALIYILIVVPITAAARELEASKWLRRRA